MARTKSFHGVMTNSCLLFQLPNDILFIILGKLVEHHTNPRDGLLPLLLTQKAMRGRRFRLYRTLIYPFAKDYMTGLQATIADFSQKKFNSILEVRRAKRQHRDAIEDAQDWLQAFGGAIEVEIEEHIQELNTVLDCLRSKKVLVVEKVQQLVDFENYVIGVIPPKDGWPHREY